MEHLRADFRCTPLVRTRHRNRPGKPLIWNQAEPELNTPDRWFWIIRERTP